MQRSLPSKAWDWLSRTSSAGFTFVELLIVVIILSILVAIAIPAYRDYEIRSEAAEAMLFISDAKVAVNEFYSRWSRMPHDNSEAGMRMPNALKGHYLRSLQIDNGVMIASLALDSGSQDNPMQRTLTFRPWVNESEPGTPVIWSCAEQDPKPPAGYRAFGDIAPDPLEPKFLPSTCRK